VLDAALAANALFQAGQGSGADVGASVLGGVVEARRGKERLRVARRSLPAGLVLLAGWTGTSAHTTPLLERFATATAPASFAELVATAERAADAAARGDAAALLDAVDRSAALLARVGADLDLPIVTPALDALVRAANRAGAVAKPSGAGAGDCGIALATSPAQAAAVRAAWQEAGILPLEIVVADEGVRVG
jgi:phosphomevalonate kinase